METRKLNELIAKHVMGWTIKEDECSLKGQKQQVYYDGPNRVCEY